MKKLHTQLLKNKEVLATVLPTSVREIHTVFINQREANNVLVLIQGYPAGLKDKITRVVGASGESVEFT